MNEPTPPRLPVLAWPHSWQLDVRRAKSDEIKGATRFWIGVTASNKMHRAEGERVLTEVFGDPKRVALAVQSMTDEERKLLGVYRRYGGMVSDGVLRLEMAARKLGTTPSAAAARQQRRYDRTLDSRHPFLTLQRRFVLRLAESISSTGSDLWRYYGSDGFFTAVAHPAVLAEVPQAGPAGFRSESQTSPPRSTRWRSPIDVALDVANLANELDRAGRWKAGRSGGMPKPVATKLRKVLSSSPITIPDPEGLIYEMLRHLGVVRTNAQEGCLERGRLEVLLAGSAEELICQLTRGWLRAELWRDGVGTVPDRVHHSGSGSVSADGSFDLPHGKWTVG